MVRWGHVSTWIRWTRKMYTPLRDPYLFRGHVSAMSRFGLLRLWRLACHEMLQAARHSGPVLDCSLSK